MSVYLPIAEMPVNALVILLLSIAVGALSGLIGVGGGFIMTPVLFLMGIPPAVAVATELSQVTAASVSGAFTYVRRRLFDLRMALLLAIGSFIGGGYGVTLFKALRAAGQDDLIVRVAYVVFLTGIGGLMLQESLAALRRKAAGLPAPKRKERTFAHALPLRMRFPESGLYISVLPPLALGALAGLLGAIMGVGGGFLLVPAMIYLLRMPTQVVVGTSLFVVLLSTAQLTIQHSVQTNSVDLILASLLIVGGVIGAQLGARLGQRLSAEHLRAVFAVLVLATGLILFTGLVIEPEQPFSLTRLDTAP